MYVRHVFHLTMQELMSFLIFLCWVMQDNIERCDNRGSLVGQEFHTTLSYVVDVEPKLWLPVRLVEGRLCR